MTPFDRLDAYLDDVKKAKEEEHSRILDENAEYLKALTAIDSLLYQLEMQDDDEDLLLRWIRKMRTAMPPSIVATRKE